MGDITVINSKIPTSNVIMYHHLGSIYRTLAAGNLIYKSSAERRERERETEERGGAGGERGEELL